VSIVRLLPIDQFPNDCSSYSDERRKETTDSRRDDGKGPGVAGQARGDLAVQPFSFTAPNTSSFSKAQTRSGEIGADLSLF